jgi:hypothetical protein
VVYVANISDKPAAFLFKKEDKFCGTENNPCSVEFQTDSGTMSKSTGTGSAGNEMCRLFFICE